MTRLRKCFHVLQPHVERLVECRGRLDAQARLNGASENTERLCFGDAALHSFNIAKVEGIV
jgi:hypothetical protein